MHTYADLCMKMCENPHFQYELDRADSVFEMHRKNRQNRTMGRIVTSQHFCHGFSDCKALRHFLQKKDSVLYVRTRVFV